MRPSALVLLPSSPGQNLVPLGILFHSQMIFLVQAQQQFNMRPWPSGMAFSVAEQPTTRWWAYSFLLLLHLNWARTRRTNMFFVCIMMIFILFYIFCLYFGLGVWPFGLFRCVVDASNCCDAKSKNPSFECEHEPGIVVVVWDGEAERKSLEEEKSGVLEEVRQRHESLERLPTVKDCRSS